MVFKEVTHYAAVALGRMFLLDSPGSTENNSIQHLLAKVRTIRNIYIVLASAVTVTFLDASKTANFTTELLSSS